jgi:hypothetical protein
MNAPSKKIWIKLRGVTAHIAGPDHSARIDLVSGMSVPGGNYDIRRIPPGVAFEVEEAEGLRMIARHGGQIVEKETMR